MNLMADMVLGGPAKVTNNSLLVCVVGAVQAGLVLAPLMLPILMVWQRGSWDNPNGPRYPIEYVPIIGKLNQMQNTIFIIGLSLIVIASINNATYVILGREMRWYNLRQMKRMGALASKTSALKDARKAVAEASAAEGIAAAKAEVEVAAAAVTAAERVVDDGQEEPEMLTRLWWVKGSMAWVWNLALTLSMFFTLSLIIELVIVIIVAITVDPFRPLAVLTVGLTIVFYIQSGVETFNSMRQKFRDSVRCFIKPDGCCTDKMDFVRKGDAAVPGQARVRAEEP